MRLCHSSSAMTSSWRARWEPRHRCGPAPNAMWLLAVRSILTSAPPANARGSRVAALIGSCTIDPAAMGQPPTSMSFLTLRAGMVKA
jgi:hypothetical protein